MKKLSNKIMGIHYSIKRLIQIIVICLMLISCNNKTQEKSSTFSSLINTAHLDSLYEEIEISNKMIGIVHIYSEYPNYNWVGDDDEGIACVDDAARAVIFYLKHYQSANDLGSLKKAERLIEFLLFMQSENGLFYNFILDDYSINKTHKNSINEPNWWSWRAMWALSESIPVFNSIDSKFSNRLLASIRSVINAFKDQYTSSKTTININGIELPIWLPQKYASDRAALIILGLTNYYEISSDSSVLHYINNLCDGILMMQKGDSLSIPYYAFLSWQNIWHAYGNSQSYALLKASTILNREDLTVAALNEINYFYDYLREENHLSNFSLRKDKNSFEFIIKKKFPQIAYNIRPMIFACLEAYNFTKDSSYAIKAGEIASWLLGNNAASAQMYFPSSGICYDGINSRNDINQNSGAESTIEALITIIKLNENLIAMTSLTMIAEQMRRKF